MGGENDQNPSLVLLHEGLGSISLWRDFSSKLAKKTGCPVVAYSRYGYGRSEVLSEPRNPDYMHYEALTVLPELLDKLGVREPILIGHSDGGSIALIYAGVCGHLAGLVLLAWPKSMRSAAMPQRVSVTGIHVHSPQKIHKAWKSAAFGRRPFALQFSPQ